MSDIFESSAVVSFLRMMPRIYKNSAIGRIGAFFSRCYETSLTRLGFERFINRNSAVNESIYAKATGTVDLFAKNCASWVLPIVDQSITWGVLRKVENIMEDSFILRPLHRLGMRRFLILLISLYLPIDYVLRQAGVSMLASVWDELFLIFAVAFLALRAMRSGESRPRALTPIDLPILLFMGIYFFMMCINPLTVSIAFEGFRAATQYLLWFFILIRLLENRKDILLFVYGFLSVAVIAALYGMYQYVMAVPIPATWVSSTEESVRTRIFSIVGSPNIMGSYMIMASCLSAGLMYTFKKLPVKIFFCALTGLMLFNLLFTLSRGAWAGVAVAVLVFALLQDKKLIALMFSGMAVSLLFVPSISSRILYLFSSDFAEASARNGRSIRWEFAYEVLFEKPLTGMGPGAFGGAVAMNNQILEGVDYFYMDNYYLKTAVETGWPGLILFLFLVLAIVIWGLRLACRISRDPISPLYKGIYASMLGVLFHCYSENIFEVPYMSAYFWCFAALLFSVYKLTLSMNVPKKSFLRPRIYP